MPVNTDRKNEYFDRAKEAEEWAAQTTDLSLRQSWLKIAEEYRLLAEITGHVKRANPAWET